MITPPRGNPPADPTTRPSPPSGPPAATAGPPTPARFAPPPSAPATPAARAPGPTPGTRAPATAVPAAADADGDDPAGPGPGEAGETTGGQPTAGDEEQLAVYGDAAYGTGELLDTLEQAGADIYCKVQPPAASGGRFTKDAFRIDLAGGAVTCPAGRTAPLRPFGDGRIASFGAACARCPLAARCTKAKDGRSIYAGPYEQQLARARARQRDPDWKAGYTTTRPKVERKIGHLMRRRHGGPPGPGGRRLQRTPDTP